MRNLIELNNQTNNVPKIVNLESQSQGVIHCEPRPYVIIECLDNKIIREQDFEGVVLTSSYLSCLYTMSYPTGSNNLSIPPQVLRRGYDYKKNKFVGTQGNARE